jgi:replicative DNA helicase
MNNPLFNADQERLAIQLMLRSYPKYLATGLSERDFATAGHVAVVRAAAALVDAGQECTHEAMQLQMQRDGTLAAIGGAGGLLAARMGVRGAILDVDKLKRLSALRRVRESLLQACLLTEQEDIQGALAKAEEASRMADATATKSLNARELAERAIEVSRDNQRNRSIIWPGSDALAESIDGFREGGLYVLGALSNVGKSFIAQDWALKCATRSESAGGPVGVGWISMEDPELTTGSRTLGMLGNVEPRSIENGKAFEHSSHAIFKAHDVTMKIGDAFLYRDLSAGTELDVCAAMSEMAARGARIIVVDYTQVVTPSQAQQDRRNDVRFMAIRMKTHAKRLKVALLLISQLTMPRDDVGVAKEPSKYSLRESGDLTNAAEAIILAWRDEESDDSPVKLKIAKSKSGGVGMQWTWSRTGGETKASPKQPKQKSESMFRDS